MLRLLVPVLLLASSSIALAQTAPPPQPTIASDEMDMSDRERQVDRAGLVTVASVQELEKRADAAVAARDCQTALELLPEFAEKANALANLIRAGLQPFYDASYEDRKRFNPTDEMIRRETWTNELVEKRNAAWVSEADCLVERGDLTGAAVRYAHALDKISLQERDTWTRARDGLWRIVGAK